MMSSEINNPIGVFTDIDGTLVLHGGELLKGVDKIFPKIVKNGGFIIPISNRSPEALKSDPNIKLNLSNNGLWTNSDMKIAAIAATGALFLDHDFSLILEDSQFLTLVQRKIIAEALAEYWSDLSLIEWVERDSNFSTFNKLKHSKYLQRFSRDIPLERVRKYHLMTEKDHEKEVRDRVKNNHKKEKEHVIRQHKKEPFDIKRIKLVEYLRQMPQDRYLKMTEFIATPKHIIKSLKNPNRMIAKIIFGFKTKDQDELIQIQRKLGEELLRKEKGLIAAPDLSNIHMMNQRDKAGAIELICKLYDLKLENCLMIGNSGIDIPAGIFIAKHHGLFIYVGKKGEKEEETKERFFKEVDHPLLKNHYLHSSISKVHEFIENKKILFHDPEKDISTIL